MRFFSLLQGYFQVFRELFVLSGRDRLWRRQLSQWPELSGTERSHPIAVQLIQEEWFLLRALYFLRAWREANPKDKSAISWILAAPFRPRPGSSLKRVFHWLQTKPWIFRRLRYALHPLGGSVGLDLFYPNSQEKWRVQAQEILSKIKTRKKLANFSLDDFLLGDLVYDTYLRYKPAPTVDLEDPFLKELLEYTLAMHERVGNYFREVRPKILICSYGSYIHHGLLVRHALKAGTKVYTLGYRSQLVVAPEKTFPFHIRNFRLYKDFFQRSPDRRQALQQGKDILELRLNGGIDPMTSFMKSSAFQKTQSDEKIFRPKRPRAVIMGHDFFDSPHCYGDMIFADFYEWLEFMMVESEKSEVDFYFKPHPNALPDNGPIYEDFRRRFPKVTFLNPKTSNRQIAEEGIDVAFTVYGTVAHEFAYLGIPVVCAGDNPHTSYDFCIHAKSAEELRSWIMKPRSISIDREQIQEFCFVHNYFFNGNRMALFPYDLDSKTREQVFEPGNPETLQKVEAMKFALQEAAP